jgi:hypothetical protein
MGDNRDESIDSRFPQAGGGVGMVRLPQATTEPRGPHYVLPRRDRGCCTSDLARRPLFDRLVGLMKLSAELAAFSQQMVTA